MSPLKTMNDIIKARGWDDAQKMLGQPIAAIARHIQKRLTDQMKRSQPAGADSRDFSDELTFTRLQEKAFNHPSLWGSWAGADDFHSRNLVIQGTTSAGKTLISELLTVDMLAHGKTVLVLVPLKSMVRERHNRFARDFRAGQINRVYASSSDYLDFDEEIMNGNFHVAVMVYEKFFAMMCQPNPQEGLLKNCKMIVVDELSMLQVNERGPKLEIAISKAMELRDPPRIVCLATTDCDTKIVEKWLSPKGREAAVSIIEPTRPVSLKEYLVMEDGSYQMRFLPGEKPEQVCSDKEGKLPVPLNPGERETERRMTILRTILQRLYPPISQQSPPSAAERPKTLIFVPSQSGTKRVASEISKMVTSGILCLDPKREEPASLPDHKRLNELIKHLDYCDPDQDLQTIKQLIGQKIAYHHGSMSTGLRETIEEIFAIDPSFKIIVATSTLTIGVNLPLDVVILLNTLVPNGNGEKVPLTMQEYMNFIGRAGRLGMSRFQAESYLIATSFSEKAYWYRDGISPTPITSALVNANEDTLIPYYLNLLEGTQITPGRLTEIHRKGLAYFCDPNQPFSPETFIKTLDKNRLLEVPDEADEEDEEEDAPACLNFYGAAFAPYALSLKTMRSLRKYFVAPGSSDTAPGLAGSGTLAEDIDSDKYLPDILYCLCLNQEIANSGTLSLRDRLLKGPEVRGPIVNRLLACFEELMLGRLPGQEKNGPARAYWRRSKLENVFESGEYSPSDSQYCALYRMILMYCWTLGYSADDIRKYVDFPISFSNGDLERLAEVFSFHLEAVHQIIAERKDLIHGDPQKLSAVLGAMRRLSRRVKYGMPSELVIIANRHVHGLDRNFILALGRAAKSKNKTPLDYLRTTDTEEILKRTHIPYSMQHLLLQRLQSRFSRNSDSDERLSELDTCAEFVSRLQLLRNFKSASPAELFALLRQIFRDPTTDSGKYCFKDCRDLSVLGDSASAVWDFYTGVQKHSIQITYCYQDPGHPDDLHAKCHVPEKVDATKIVLFNGYRCPPEKQFAERLHGGIPDAGITCFGLARLIAGTLLLGVEDAAKLLYQTLHDIRGFHNELPFAWLNYQPVNAVEWKDAAYQLLIDSAEDEEVLRALGNDGELNRFHQIPWGRELSPEEETFLATKPLVILLSRETVRIHHSLMQIVYRLSQMANHGNVLILVKEEADVENWGSASDNPHGLRWDGFPEFHVKWYASTDEKVEAIRDFLHTLEIDKHGTLSFKIAVSYPRYDSQGQWIQENNSNYSTDNQKLDLFVQELNRAFGENQVLYDQNAKASTLFVNGPEKALGAYGTCVVGVALCNSWGTANEWCRQERKSMWDAGADMIFLRTNSTPEIVDGQPFRTAFISHPLPVTEDQRASLIKLIRNCLEQHRKEQKP